MAARYPEGQPSHVSELSMASPSVLDLPSYKMDAIPRGICVIINNHRFDPDISSQAMDLDDRPGTEVDRDKLKATFQRLHFTVEVYEDQTDREILDIMKKMSTRDHSLYDCFVCCVLSHGDRGVVFGSNGKPVRTIDLTRHVKPDRCPTLTGKPKLFFLQACRGGVEMEGYEPDSVREREDMGTVPHEADFLVSYSTAPGYVSWRHPEEGTWYISALTELLDKHAHSHDMMEILTAVHNYVGRKAAFPEGRQAKQAPVLTHALRYKLLFTGINPLTATLRCTFSMDNQQLRVPGDKMAPRFTCLAVTGGGRVVMADVFNESVKVLDAGSPASISTLSLGVKPWSLAACQDGLVAVTSFSDYVIHLIDVTGTPSVVQQIKTARKYQGVGCGGVGDTLLVSCKEDEDGPAQLDVITRKGAVERTIVDTRTLPGLMLPGYLCVVGGQVLLSDTGADCVWRVDVATGSLQAKHTHQELKYPRQVTADRAGNMYVASALGQCVLVMGRDGQWRTLLRGKEHGEGRYVRPHCVALTGTRLFVGWGLAQCVLLGYEWPRLTLSVVQTSTPPPSPALSAITF